MRSPRRLELSLLAIIGAMLVASAIVWPVAPESFPVHFDLLGQPDRYGSKAEGLLAMPIVALLTYAVLRWLPRLDPARANYAAFGAAYSTIRVAVMLVFAAIHAALLLPLIGIPVDQAMAIRVIVGALLIALGAVLGKIRPNWLVGVRTPWTLASKQSWVRSHRLAGWVFILSGVTWIGSAGIEGVRGILLALGVTGVGLIWTIVYSYLVWRRDPDRFPAISTRPAGDLPSGQG